jgi:hypothetical protein
MGSCGKETWQDSKRNVRLANYSLHILQSRHSMNVCNIARTPFLEMRVKLY